MAGNTITRDCPSCGNQRQVLASLPTGTYPCPDCKTMLRLTWHTLASCERVPALRIEPAGTGSAS